MILAWVALVLAITGSPAAAGDDASLTVRITGIEITRGGSVLVSLFDSSASYEKRQPVRRATLAATNEELEWSLEGLLPGDYAVMVIHDLNDNARLDFSALGPPREPVAMSNAARGFMGFPSFEAARFEVEAGQNSVAIAFKERAVWSAGLGVVTGTRPYRGISGRFLPIPIVGYEGERLSWRGPRLTYRAYSFQQLEVRALAEVRFSGYDADDSSRLDGMSDRKLSLDGGVELAWSFWKRWRLESAFVRDLLGHHRGQEFRASLGRSIPAGSWTVTPSIGLNVISNRTADYYYGVRRGEARAGRPAYNVGSALNWKAGLGVTYRSSGRWRFISNANLEFLDSDIDDSPIVKRDTILGVFCGVIYAF